MLTYESVKHVAANLEPGPKRNKYLDYIKSVGDSSIDVNKINSELDTQPLKPEWRAEEKPKSEPTTNLPPASKVGPSPAAGCIGYTVKSMCNNCYWFGNVDIPKGTPIYEAVDQGLCPCCGCEDLGLMPNVVRYTIK